ncbi:hypothetical protein DMA15_03580 [Streptomyces sp. WAC 01529]|uniref:hypothetical protein n=1 Tax=Streptomyces sp. WAC 01529 TaxID=2203205 RepID=UPI000F6DB746|nr:hypothetical protein [Streptomyces sp. WAC 01529]AZM51774.1 hypothetical protein DMA15_03580 [Streptomyces sp. WAC 01529]
MAALDPNRYPLMWMNGESDRVALYALRDITAADTLDVIQQFTVIKRAVIMGTTVAAAVGASIAGTTVTIPAGANRDGAYLLVYGVAGVA